MPYKDPDKAKQYAHEHYLKNKDKWSERSAKWKDDNRELVAKRSLEAYHKKREAALNVWKYKRAILRYKLLANKKFTKTGKLLTKQLKEHDTKRPKHRTAHALPSGLQDLLFFIEKEGRLPTRSEPGGTSLHDARAGSYKKYIHLLDEALPDWRMPGVTGRPKGRRSKAHIPTP